jgi:hypothetical protein
MCIWECFNNAPKFHRTSREFIALEVEVILIGEFNYHDICLEIDILNIYRDDLKNEQNLLQDALIKKGYDSEWVSNRVDIISHKIRDYKTVIKEKEKLKIKAEGNARDLEGIDSEVVFLRDVGGMSLKEISGELNYSYDWVKKISARNKKEQSGVKT